MKRVDHAISTVCDRCRRVLVPDPIFVSVLYGNKIDLCFDCAMHILEYATGGPCTATVPNKESPTKP